MWEVKSFMSQSCCHPQHVFQYVLQHPRKEPEKSIKKKIIMIITKNPTKNFAKDSRSLSESDILDNKHLFGLKLL